MKVANYELAYKKTAQKRGGFGLGGEVVIFFMFWNGE